MTVDQEGFKALMEEQKVRARKAREALGDLGWAGIEFGKDMPATEFVGYDQLERRRARCWPWWPTGSCGTSWRQGVRGHPGAGPDAVLCRDGRPGGRPRHHSGPRRHASR